MQAMFYAWATVAPGFAPTELYATYALGFGAAGVAAMILGAWRVVASIRKMNRLSRAARMSTPSVPSETHDDW
ncbi:hypothetical protein M2322_004607 [Rhodoblastus acidophilus]|uniref:hypothetical protein n=1 Tax=Rhodoblastus acidophilus TaxID=1074 RepID=UPI002224FFF4|nr:hypothetical protein [Rhodoblastus acidophilus]MCW2319038.1 hypothetical protein [Rhodoblastus acidophilus]